MRGTRRGLLLVHVADKGQVGSARWSEKSIKLSLFEMRFGKNLRRCVMLCLACVLGGVLNSKIREGSLSIVACT
ncbi:hypothetical protein BJX66DRAFT_302513 [Aspergillus keveii]|uniref:Uncharacterized protein n=1 Tax=Aspergillus keveii TaxID=714993 RepID=A0ABR4G7P6_9EURO